MAALPEQRGSVAASRRAVRRARSSDSDGCTGWAPESTSPDHECPGGPMTHSIDAPLPPPSTGSGATTTSGVPTTGTTTPGTTTTGTTTTGMTTTTGTTTTGTSTTDVAKDEAKNVGQTAAQAGSQVASTATDQAKEVAQETQRQAKDLLDQGRSQLREQTISQQQKAAPGLSSPAQELRRLADASSQGAPGPARDLLQQASGMVEQFAAKLQNREPGELLDEVRSFARRKPGVFLLGAAAAGVLAGRLTSGVKAAHTDTGSSGGVRRDTGVGGNYVVDTGPAYAEETYVEATYTPGAGTTAVPPPPPTTSGAPLPPPPSGPVPPAGSAVPPTTPAGWDDPTRRPGGVG